ncbi:type II toxin-antitoxin system RelE/ParE family toxin [Paraburkholderia sp. 2C]
MTTSEVRFAPEALEHLTDLERYLADVSSPRVAARYVDGIAETARAPANRAPHLNSPPPANRASSRPAIRRRPLRRRSRRLPACA